MYLGRASGEGLRTSADARTQLAGSQGGHADAPPDRTGKNVGTNSTDLLVEDRLLVEVKCVGQFSNEHLAQCINYLKASGLHLALLINFRRPRVEWRRVVHEL